MVTPFQSDLTVDYKALAKIIDFVIEGGIEYLVTMGTTGETPTLSKEEKKALKKELKQKRKEEEKAAREERKKEEKRRKREQEAEEHLRMKEEKQRKSWSWTDGGCTSAHAPFSSHRGH